jgi:hypothetical protein
MQQIIEFGYSEPREGGWGGGNIWILDYILNMRVREMTGWLSVDDSSDRKGEI